MATPTDDDTTVTSDVVSDVPIMATTTADDTMATSDVVSADVPIMAAPTDDDTMETSHIVTNIPIVMTTRRHDIDCNPWTRGVVSSKFKVTRGVGGGLMENAKVNIDKLYLCQIFAGPGANQSDVIEPNAVTGLGKTGVSNWTIYDAAGPHANLVANGQGMYTLAGNWNQWLTLVFEAGRFKGSTLQVMGASAEDAEDEWAIVGGTREFAMARGIIKRRLYREIRGTSTQELTIEFFCRMKVPAPTKSGPWGGIGGTLREMEGKSQRLESVIINHGGTVNSMKFSYIDEDGQIRTAGVWGETLGHDKNETIKFGPSEFVKQLNGTATSSSPVKLSKFQIVTNHKTYGPFGVWDGGASFSYIVPEDETVVGFFAQTERYVHMIGVYTI